MQPPFDPRSQEQTRHQPPSSKAHSVGGSRATAALGPRGWKRATGWILYVLAVIFLGAYLIGSVIAFLANFAGAAKLFALAVPVNGLFLPFFGRGTLFGIEVHSFIWWWLFGIGGACGALVARGGPFQLFVSVEDASGDSHLMGVEKFRGALLEGLQTFGCGVSGITAYDLRYDFMRFMEVDTIKRELEFLVRIGLARKEASADGGSERYFPTSAVEDTSSMTAPEPDLHFVREDQGGLEAYPTYSVVERTAAGDFFDLICSGLGLEELEAFASYPEVRPRMLERWEGMKAKSSWEAPVRTNARVARAIVKARTRNGPAIRPPIYLRSELERRASAAPDSVICQFCLAPNPPERVNCDRCGRQLAQ